MFFAQMKALVMHQTNNDVEDLVEFMPYLGNYLNEGYNKLAEAWDGGHIYSEKYPALSMDHDEPRLPEWTHAVIVDWATWLVYRNGNPSKQSRGYAFRDSAERMLLQIRGMMNADKGNPSAPKRGIVNIPK